MGFKAIAILGIASILSACSTNNLYQKVLNVPDWIMSPTVTDGVAASKCVPWAGDYTANKTSAGKLAKQQTIDVVTLRLRSLGAEWLKQIDFNTVEEHVSQGRVIRVDFADLDGTEQLCTMWYVNDIKLKQLLVAIAANNETVLDESRLESLLQKIKSS